MNNPFINPGIAQNYESTLNLPFVRTIRRQEQALLSSVFDKCLNKNHTVLEIGAGTGFYTVDIAKRVNSVLALEPAADMSKYLQDKLRETRLDNIKIVNADFWDYKTAQKFDYVILIGVLDYIEDWQNFLERCSKLAAKGIILTAPQSGLLSKIYSFLAKVLENTKIYSYSPDQFRKYFAGHKVQTNDAGLKLGFLKGLTLIAYIAL